MDYALDILEEKPEPVDLHTLHSFRFEDGSAFPLSYTAFAQKYGYGVTCGQFLIFMPLENDCDSFMSRSCAIRSTYSDVLTDPDSVWFDLSPDGSFDILKRLIPFASSENGYYLFWDPARTIPDEMDIYITDFRGLGFVNAAGTLYELIEKMTSPVRFKEVFPFFIQKELPATFHPILRKS